MASLLVATALPEWVAEMKEQEMVKRPVAGYHCVTLAVDEYKQPLVSVIIPFFNEG